MVLPFKKTIDSGLAEKFDATNRFQLKRLKTSTGRQKYLLENLGRGEDIEIYRHQFDCFRATLCEIHTRLQTTPNPGSADIDQRVFWGDQEIFRISSQAPHQQDLLIRDRRNQKIFHCSPKALGILIELLYSDKTEHPSDVFDHIVDYHKLFQLTFRESTGSINSALLLQKELMIEKREYQPSLNEKTVKRFFQQDPTPSEGEIRGIVPSTNQDEKNSRLFKSKLGQRDSDLDYAIDYDSLFTGLKAEKPHSDRTPSRLQSVIQRASETSFSLPLFAQDIKSLGSHQLKCEFHAEEAEAFRDLFIRDRHAELFLGIEILDAIYRERGKLWSLRFPLYYVKVKVEEAGRSLHVSIDSSGDIFLNHLALAILVERFSPLDEGKATEVFFSHLLAQKIDLDKRLHPIRIQRQLPFHEDVFLQTRDVLIGSPGENGKGGILQNLKLIGVECDLESVILYKSTRQSSVLNQSLDQDLNAIHNFAHEAPSRFYQSLLGKFLVPERQNSEKNNDLSYSVALFPGPLPATQRRLMRHLGKQDILLLEGPPGTGKTHTIMNLLIHSINTGKKILIVSDQKSAIHALTEKIVTFLTGRDRSSSEAIQTLHLWQSAVKVIDTIPDSEQSLGLWTAQLCHMLALDKHREGNWLPEYPGLDDQLQKIDQKIQECRDTIDTILESRYGGEKIARQISPKHAQSTTENDILDLQAFLDFIGAGHYTRIKPSAAHQAAQQMIEHFISLRKDLAASQLRDCYGDFTLDGKTLLELHREASHSLSTIERLIQTKPKKSEDFRSAFRGDERSLIANFLLKHWQDEYSETRQHDILHKLSTLLGHPCLKAWQNLANSLRFHIQCIEKLQSETHSSALQRQFQAIHLALAHPNALVEMPLALEIATLMTSASKHTLPSIHLILMRMDALYHQRNDLTKKKLIQNLASIAQSVLAPQKTGTNALTAIETLLEGLKDCKSVAYGSGFAMLQDLQERLIATFPIWICRKQAVPFLFPSRDKIFDLLIVDEAGQCRVDDAIPLMFRAKKMLAVGDEKQTVLDKRSPIDDYLFQECELEDMLRSSQARGIKGGGSNLFSLIKSVKQGGLMLDEHYRCPPAIIRYSNAYVYDNQLKIMQWQAHFATPAVVIDYSEQHASPSKKPSSGKYKGIETDMIDRFFEFVARTIRKIEKEEGQTIQLETDVALCYFLLKNEVYFKDAKAKFLQQLKRGQDVLDGAGAALQGKERKYVFYFWDINKSNIAFFKQGDDPDKRRGELNVLMSRPKVRAYHFLHRAFSELKHENATITDYLWRAYLAQSESQGPAVWQARQVRPGKQHRPWQRASGPTILGILKHIVKKRDPGLDLGLLHPQFSVTVGDPKQRVDLILWSAAEHLPPLGLIDLSGFETHQNPAREVIDFYFQLKRALPTIEPIFFFMHEIADDRHETYRYLEHKLLELTSSAARHIGGTQ